MRANEAEMIHTDHTLHDRFWQRVIKGDPDACWEWQGARRASGYGVISVGGRKLPILVASRIMAVWEGHDIAGLIVMHTCDNPPCVNPKHLVPGTTAQNLEDMRRKNRHRPQRGENHRAANLTNEQVISIRQLLAEGNESAEISRMLGVPYYSVYDIASGKKWRTVGTQINHPPPSNKGPRNGRAILTSEMVAEARTLYLECWNQRAVARRMSIRNGTMSKAIVGHSHPEELTVPPVPHRLGSISPLTTRPLTDEQVKAIRIAASFGGISPQEIAEDYKISLTDAFAMLSGKSYSWVNLE